MTGHDNRSVGWTNLAPAMSAMVSVTGHSKTQSAKGPVRGHAGVPAGKRTFTARSYAALPLFLRLSCPHTHPIRAMNETGHINYPPDRIIHEGSRSSPAG